MKIILLGNAGSGKTTMARRLVGGRDIACLSLDAIAWDPGVKRKPISESVVLLRQFMSQHVQWIIEGCYGRLIEEALPHCDELRFLNPGVEICQRHCRRRPWEPEKFRTPEEQQRMLDGLLAWVSRYEDRTDEFGLACHRRLYDAFAGPKREYTADDYDDAPAQDA